VECANWGRFLKNAYFPDPPVLDNLSVDMGVAVNFKPVNNVASLIHDHFITATMPQFVLFALSRRGGDRAYQQEAGRADVS